MAPESQIRELSTTLPPTTHSDWVMPLPSPPSHDGSIVQSTIFDGADSYYDRSAAGPGHTTRSFDRFIRSCYVFALECQDGFADRYLQAGVAQWQSSGFVNRRLEVQFLSPAPTFQALTLAAISVKSSGVITVLER